MKLLKTVFTVALVLLGLQAAALYALDVTSTAAAAQSAIGTAIPLLQQLAALPPTMLGIIAAFGLLAGFLMEHGMEKFLMDHLGNGTVKAALPYIGGILTAAVANMGAGMAWGPALLTGALATATANTVHTNIPTDSPAALKEATPPKAAA